MNDAHTPSLNYVTCRCVYADKLAQIRCMEIIGDDSHIARCSDI